MGEVVAGSKKAAQEAQAVIEPESGELVVSNCEIKSVILAYCLDVLRNKKPDKQF